MRNKTKKIPYLVISKINNSIYLDLIMEDLMDKSKKNLNFFLIILPDIVLILLMMVIFKPKEETNGIILLFFLCQKTSFDLLNLRSISKNITRKEIKIQVNQLKKHELIHSFLSRLFNFNHAIIIMNYNAPDNFSCSGFTLITRGTTSSIKNISFSILNFFYDLFSYFKSDLKYGNLEPFHIAFKELIQELFLDIRSAQEPITNFKTYQDIRNYAYEQSNNNFKKLDNLFKNRC